MINAKLIPLQTSLGIDGDGVRGKKTNDAIMKAADDGFLAYIGPLPAQAPAMPAKGTKAPTGQATGAGVWPKATTAGLVGFYGQAGSKECTSGSVILPFPFLLAWDKREKVLRASCHKKVEVPLTEIWNEAAEHYGEKKFRELRLDLFGGCYNYRMKRSGTSLSLHSWGIAWDVDPENNTMNDGASKATLDGSEYEPFWKIVEAKGGVSLGRKKNYDWMHFQFATL